MYIYVNVYICISVYMSICLYVYMYIRIYVYIYICIYVYMYHRVVEQGGRIITANLWVSHNQRPGTLRPSMNLTDVRQFGFAGIAVFR